MSAGRVHIISIFALAFVTLSLLLADFRERREGNTSLEEKSQASSKSSESYKQWLKKIVDAVNDVLGSKNHFQNLDEIQKSYREMATPAYDKANAYGDLAKIDPKISGFVKNEDQLQKAISKARSSAIGRDLKGLPDTDIRVLDSAKQVMDDDISGLKRNGANKEARALDGLRTDLLKKVDTIAPEYAQARQIAGDHIRMMDAQETGAKILRSETPESIARILPEMSPAEQAALKVGFRDELIKQIGQGSKTSRANVAMKVFGETENSLTRQNMKAILGEDYAPLMKKVEPLITGGRNYSDLMGGSQTAPNQQLTGRLSLHGIVLKTLKKAVNSQMNQKTTMQARALTDPEYLRKIIGK